MIRVEKSLRRGGPTPGDGGRVAGAKSSCPGWKQPPPGLALPGHAALRPHHPSDETGDTEVVVLAVGRKTGNRVQIGGEKILL